MTNDVHHHFWWLLSRSAGVVALVLVAVSVLIGLTLAAGLGGPPARRRALVAIHEHSALASLVAIALHGVTLLGDSFLKPGVAGIAIPFVIDYKPVFVGLGIIGGYLAAILGLSFYARRRIGGKRWRNMHRATPVVYVLGLVHTLGAGTDAGSTWLRAFMLSTAVAAAGLLIARIRKSKSKTKAPARRPVTTQGANS
jgi:sulfoxide reductase heme-binding subunit YedZ